MYQGFYINLARNEKRRLAMERELLTLNGRDRYQRYEAVDGRAVASQYEVKMNPGALGCWLSHKNILQAHRSTSVHLHILEDDTLFCRGALEYFDGILKFADAQVVDWDLICTDVNVFHDPKTFNLFAKKMSEFEKVKASALLDLRGMAFAAPASYFVNRHRVDKVASQLGEKWTTGRPFDLVFRDLVKEGKLKALVTVPFLTARAPNNWESDIDGARKVSYKVFDLYRRAFFIDADLPGILREMEELTKEGTISPLTTIFLKTIQFSLSDQFVPF